MIILPSKYSTENISPGTHSQERDKIIMKVVPLSNNPANSNEKKNVVAKNVTPIPVPGLFAPFALYAEKKLSMSQL